jgi:hypothetical protein
MYVSEFAFDCIQTSHKIANLHLEMETHVWRAETLNQTHTYIVFEVKSINNLVWNKIRYKVDK